MNEWTEQSTYRRSVQEKLDLILAQTTATNGRLRSAEIWIGRLQVGYGVGAAVGMAFIVWVLGKL